MPGNGASPENNQEPGFNTIFCDPLTLVLFGKVHSDPVSPPLSSSGIVLESGVTVRSDLLHSAPRLVGCLHLRHSSGRNKPPWLDSKPSPKTPSPRMKSVSVALLFAASISGAAASLLVAVTVLLTKPDAPWATRAWYAYCSNAPLGRGWAVSSSRLPLPLAFRNRGQ